MVNALVSQVESDEAVSHGYLSRFGRLEAENKLTDALVELKKAFIDPQYADLAHILQMNLERIAECSSRKALGRDYSADALAENSNNPTTYAEYARNGGSAPLVSLTTVSTRINRVWETVSTISNQTLKAHSINLYISEDPYLIDAGISRNDDNLKRIADLGANVYFVENIGPYRKQMPIIHQLHNCGAVGATPFITFDDDVIYPQTIIEELVRESENTNAVISHRGRQITFANGWFAPYKAFVPPSKRPSILNLGTGRNGILYRLKFFPRIYDDYIGPSIAPTADDLWCKYITAGYCIPTVILEPTAMHDTTVDFKETQPDDKCGLFHNFNAKGRNDLALTALELYFSREGRGMRDLSGGE